MNHHTVSADRADKAAAELATDTNAGSSTGPATSAASALERELAQLLVQALNLEVAAADLDPAVALYGDGLGLDSIDILELALEVSTHYGFQLRADDEDNHHIFQSLRSLAAHVAVHRSK